MRRRGWREERSSSPFPLETYSLDVERVDGVSTVGARYFATAGSVATPREKCAISRQQQRQQQWVRSRVGRSPGLLVRVKPHEAMARSRGEPWPAFRLRL